MGAEIEEDWLRYSPPRSDEVVIEEDLAVEEEEEGKIVSRFASEIEGDCIPVTGPDGERVYAKINRVEEEDNLRRLDVKQHTKGKPLFIQMFSRVLFFYSKSTVEFLLRNDRLHKWG